MQRVSRASAVASLPAPPAGGTPGFFTGGNPGAGQPATVPGYEWFNAVQEEMLAVILRGGLTASNADLAQMRKSLDRLFGGGLASLSANTTLTVDEAGEVLVNASGAARTITLPAANALGGRPIRYRIVKTDNSVNLVTVQRAGSDTIDGATSAVLRSQFDGMTLISDGVSAWMIASGGIGARSLTANGWARFPGGLIFQWGSAPLPANGGVLVTFPISFPQANFQMFATVLASAAAATAVGWEPVSASQARFWNGSTSNALTASWFAIGA